VIQRGEHLRFALETRHALGVCGEALRQDFERDVATQLRVARPIHLAHAARAERGENLIGTELGPWG
jgi:hypothetical protein